MDSISPGATADFARFAITVPLSVSGKGLFVFVLQPPWTDEAKGVKWFCCLQEILEVILSSVEMDRSMW